MKQLLLVLLFVPAACSLTTSRPGDGRYSDQAARVTIIRDQWGIPHIYGKTDADAVFGLMYTQCEENFEAVERAYIEKLGRLSEIEGEAYLASDLESRLLFDTSAAKADYQRSPEWLRKLLLAFADGINFYLFKHPDVKPALLKHFEPWFPLLFTDGGYTALQTGGLQWQDINNLYFPSAKIKSYSLNAGRLPEEEPTGSNGFAVAPSRTVSQKALLYINPHVSFYFRMEAHMVSEEGLNTYGAVTWGQFFVYQGFNEHCGWMHTSSMADASDLYAEKIVQKNNAYYYEYGGALKVVNQKTHILSSKKNDTQASQIITAYYTHHGPVAGIRGGKWLSLKEQNRSLNGLIQSWQRTRARNFTEFEQSMQLRSNGSTNTLYADDQGNIAYWHGNFIPVRDPKLDWAQPVDGSDPATEWHGIHAVNELVHLHNPQQGWIQNCNSTPFSASGLHSLDKKKYPVYMAPDGENFRSLLAIKELEKEPGFTMDKLIALGYNHYLAIFDSLLPPLFNAFDQLGTSDPLYPLVKEPVALLRSWDKRSDISSVAATLAIEWGHQMIYNGSRNLPAEKGSDQVGLFTFYARNTDARTQLEMMAAVIRGLAKTYGTWKVPWGEINRYQRMERGDQRFDDTKESLPVGMASALLGSLPAFETVWYETSKGYGVAGNSFVAVVEFGKKIKAKAVATGGQSFDPGSKHFLDQAQMFIEGRFREVLFYKEDVLKAAESIYHPGEEN